MPAYSENPALLKRYREGDAMALESLLVANEPLVRIIAGRFHHEGGALELADLEQEGRLALLRAASLFDPTRGAAFGTYASMAIRSAVSRAVKQARLIAIPVDRTDTAALPRVTASLDAPAGEEDAGSLADTLPDPFDLEAAVVGEVWLASLLEELAPRDRALLCRRFGIGRRSQTYAEMGRATGRTDEGARQALLRLLARLQEAALTASR